MKKRIAITILAALIGAFTPTETADAAATRTATGVYFDYMCIVTRDGHEWLLSDARPAKNPYMKKRTVYCNGRRRKEYAPIFRAGQMVKVKFDTRGTAQKSDDKILSVKPIR